MSPEMEYDCDSKNDPVSEGFSPIDRRVRSNTKFMFLLSVSRRLVVPVDDDTFSFLHSEV